MHHPHEHTTDDNPTDYGRPEGRGHRGARRGGRGSGRRGGGHPGLGPRGRRELGPIDPEASELELIQHLARRLRRGSLVETAPWDLSPHQARALAVIARATGRRHHRSSSADVAGTPAVYTGLRLGALAEWLQIAPRSATEVVDGLEEAGLVARTPDPDDRRAVLVGLTDRGRETAAEVRAARRAQTETLLEELSEADRTQLRASLLTLLNAAGR